MQFMTLHFCRSIIIDLQDTCAMFRISSIAHFTNEFTVFFCLLSLIYITMACTISYQSNMCWKRLSIISIVSNNFIKYAALIVFLVCRFEIDIYKNMHQKWQSFTRTIASQYPNRIHTFECPGCLDLDTLVKAYTVALEGVISCCWAIVQRAGVNLREVSAERYGQNWTDHNRSPVSELMPPTHFVRYNYVVQ